MNCLTTRRAIAFVRALLREMGADAISFESLRAFIQTDEVAAAAAKLVDGCSVLGVTPEGSYALNRLANAYAGLYDLQKETQVAFHQLDDAFSEVREKMGRGSEEASVIALSQLEVNRSFWLAYIHALCYVVACLYGTAPLSDLRSIAIAGIASLDELRRAARELLTCASNLKELGCWTISRETGRWTPYLVGKTRFVFDWQSVDLETLVRLNDLEPLAFGIAGAKNRLGTVVLAGCGYVVGTKMTDSLKLRDHGVHVSLPIEALTARGVSLVNPADPRPALERYFRDDAYCLHPEQLADALDYLSQMREGAL